MVCYGLLAIGVCIGDKFDTFIGRGERVGGGGKERREGREERGKERRKRKEWDMEKKKSKMGGE